MPLDEPDTARLAALRRAVYSRGGSPEDLAELRELERRAADPEPPQVVAEPAPEPQAQLETGPQPEAEPQPEAQPQSEAAVSPVAPAPKRRTLRRAIAVVAAAIVVAGIGYAIGRVPTNGADPSASQAKGVAPLSLLDTARTQEDVPPVALDGDITAGTIHLLKWVQTRGVSVYAGRTNSGLICLVAVTSGLETAQSCATRSDFLKDGIRLRITTNHLVQNDRVPNSQAYWEYYWQGDGKLSAESNISPFGSAP